MQESAVPCYHCGEACDKERWEFEQKDFCCNGCLQAHKLIESSIKCAPDGESLEPEVDTKRKWEELEIPAVAQRFIVFEDEESKHYQFRLPQLHCASCVYVLERLSRIDSCVISSEVQFVEKTIRMVVQPDFSLSDAARLCALVGYSPDISFDQKEEKSLSDHRKKRLRELVVAGFCFGNIMLFSLPEYFDLDMKQDPGFVHFFRTADLLLALPIFLYSSQEFYRGALSGIRGRYMHLDFPLVISLFVAFGRSVYEVLSGTGGGYFDSYAGIVFFMLVGRQFQDVRTERLGLFKTLKSYFPIAVSVFRNGKFDLVALSEIEEGEEIKIHSHEIIPADGELLSDTAYLDYAFVTGESDVKRNEKGRTIYAGARNMGGTLHLRVSRKIEESHLGALWNKEAKSREWDERQSFTHIVARWFTLFLIVLSVGAFLMWWPSDHDRAFKALTTALIVACPCALLLSHTFTTGSATRQLASVGILLKNSFVWDKLAVIKQFFFDKTGTLTDTGMTEVRFEGEELTDEEKEAVSTLTHSSLHPISMAIAHSMTYTSLAVESFEEVPGDGIYGKVNGIHWSLRKYVVDGKQLGTALYKEGNFRGFFHIHFPIRENIQQMLDNLSKKTKLGLVSGDTDREQERMEKLFPAGTELHFELTPVQKAELVAMRESESHTAYVGDGLNDTGALHASHVGISISDSHQRFTPAADILLPGEQLKNLPELYRFGKQVKGVVWGSFVLSLMYNTVGLSYALSGTLSPLIAALLMPASTFSIIIFTTLTTKYFFRKTYLDKNQRSL